MLQNQTLSPVRKLMTCHFVITDKIFKVIGCYEMQCLESVNHLQLSCFLTSKRTGPNIISLKNAETQQRAKMKGFCLSGIQQENRHIRQLQQENKELRAALEEHQNAIELIMSKYRQHMMCLVNSSKIDQNAVKQSKTRVRKVTNCCHECIDDPIVFHRCSRREWTRYAKWQQ